MPVSGVLVNVAPMVERAPANGSCSRCGRALDLSAQKVDGQWVGKGCASGGRCDEAEGNAPPKHWLYNRPRRFFRKRAPLELKRKR